MSVAAETQASEAPVPLLDLQAQYGPLRAELLARITEVCDSQQFILGANVKELEAKVAEYSQCRFGVGVASGTDALLVALMALEVGPGDEVITSPYTFFATGGVVARLGARPVFCDIEPDTYNLSPSGVETFIRTECTSSNGKLINRRTGGTVKVLMPVHLFGQLADMDALLAIARRYDLRVVEDAAQAIGAESANGRRAGSFGDIGCFSFFPSKNLGAFGDAGMCTTNDPALAERLAVLRVHGGKPKYHHALIGGNFRLDELQAAVLRVKLRHLDDWTAGRTANASDYDAALQRAGLGEKVKVPVRSPGFRHIYNQYVIRVERRDALRQHLTKAGIGTEIYYPIPLHRQKCFAYLGYDESQCVESVRAACETIAIPIYPELEQSQKRRVVDTIVDFYR